MQISLTWRKILIKAFKTAKQKENMLGKKQLLFWWVWILDCWVKELSCPNNGRELVDDGMPWGNITSLQLSQDTTEMRTRHQVLDLVDLVLHWDVPTNPWFQSSLNPEGSSWHLATEHEYLNKGQDQILNNRLRVSFRVMPTGCHSIPHESAAMTKECLHDTGFSRA